ncbi:MAG: hypothetical protein ACYC91_07680 [Solirubrobacteraceae bacterium]
MEATVGAAGNLVFALIMNRARALPAVAQAFGAALADQEARLLPSP